MRYIIASTAVTDEIRFADGRNVEKVAGGAGIYALCGVKLWCDDVMLATGVGADFDSIYGDWYRKNNLSMEGLIIKDEKTPHTVIQYFEDGEREEIPLYGPDHYKKIETVPEDLEGYFKSAKGIYIFKNSDEKYWKQILKYKKNSPAKVMWEIGSDATFEENYSLVKGIAGQLDIFSINIGESVKLLGKKELTDIIKEYQTWGLPLVFLRRGAEGSVMITPEEAVYVPSQTGVHVADPTGGGNSSSGAVLYGFCEGFSPEICGIMGSISAAMCISQYGVPEEITEEMRENAREKTGLA
ncbi:carbohydrate kinase family protein [Ruminococcus sp. 5_1_39BFAA]|uniref:carbohydrate kinase family protein n=1 Tax=Ruminococcus sp. 5_1_39BFAA TaxID=457412 RepID=UPI0035672F9B